MGAHVSTHVDCGRACTCAPERKTGNTTPHLQEPAQNRVPFYQSSSFQSEMKLQGKVFIVTGGASGLGKATAELLLANGADVSIWDMNDEEGSKMESKRCRFFKVNVTKENSILEALEQTKKMGSIRGLINCAGIGAPSKVVSKRGPHRMDIFDLVIKVNLSGSFNTLRLVAKEMANNEPIDGERGIIINTASIAAFEGQIGQASYSASKGGIVAMTLPIARELARHGIRHNTIAPGLFLTPMLQKLPEKAKKSLAKQCEFPSRLGNPEEYAHLAKHIIENQYINGTVIRIDAGIRMSKM
eukprot:CAMPEP_0184487418 /NCGR_PEP_ID=MMETSP0113_2-20130426/10046_1 /TAXON_ID=91329 /ORGANISM="Norrisiella sphaerica, Strain BC52" /LENGTH=299 /DNA_ID=CAMNT_0026869729 /DNA_START=17 /DNA_END=916 /DNA_ORIENTATION=-